jgi:YD repeat-containing protein
MEKKRQMTRPHTSHPRLAFHRVPCRSFARVLLITLAAACLLLLTISLSPPARARQGAGTTYVYDDTGRLRAVLSPNGDAAVYEYDAAGNLTAVRRLTSNDLEILTFTPRQGPVGTLVTIFGVGFNQGVNSVSFNGSAAVIVSANQSSVVAVVPQGATTGPINVVTPHGAVNSATPFVVKGVLVTPQSVTLPALDSTKFGLTVSGTQTGEVVWTVNGVDGGNSSVGIVTAQGLYTAPNLVGSNTVRYIVRATSVDDSSLFGEASAYVIPFGAGFQFRSVEVSVRYGTPPNSPHTYFNNALSVRYGTLPNNSPTYIKDTLSVRYGTPPNTPKTYVDGAASVRYGTTPANAPAFVNGNVSASRGPVLTSLNPVTMSRGSTLSLTVNGVALSGATVVKFFNLSNGNPENGITVSNLSVNGQGTSLTATITVAAGVAVGRYVVVVTTPAGSTVRNDAGTNTVQIN